MPWLLLILALLQCSVYSRAVLIRGQRLILLCLVDLLSNSLNSAHLAHSHVDVRYDRAWRIHVFVCSSWPYHWLCYTDYEVFVWFDACTLLLRGSYLRVATIPTNLQSLQPVIEGDYYSKCGVYLRKYWLLLLLLICTAQYWAICVNRACGKWYGQNEHHPFALPFTSVQMLCNVRSFLVCANTCWTEQEWEMFLYIYGKMHAS